jgi:hypothetical protein
MSLLAWRSAALAFRAQAVLFVVALAAIASAFSGWGFTAAVHTPVWFGTFEALDLQDSFSLFFPAVTGIMVGAGMSGQLADPRRSLPTGTLGAWAFTTVVYVVGAVWYATMAPPEELLSNPMVMVERAAVGPVVLGGLLVSTLMAALSSLVAAPRLLVAMAEQGVVPGSRWLRRRDGRGEPTNAVLATTLLAGAGLFAGSLDAIAPVITSFFLLTYLTIHVVVYVEGVLGMVSWRPTFRVSRLIPLFGITSCLFALVGSSPWAGLVEIFVVAAVYVFVASRQLQTPWETVRSGVLVSLAAWAARLAAPVGRTRRAWKPDMLVPVATVGQLDGLLPYVDALAGPQGTLRFVALGGRPDLLERGPAVVARLRAGGRDASWASLETRHYMDAVNVALDVLQGGALFPPNLVVVDARYVSNEEIAEYLTTCKRIGIGMILHVGKQGPLKRPDGVAVWLSDRSPDWSLELRTANLDLPVLVGWLASQVWHAPLQVATVVRDPEHAPMARAFLQDVVDQARLSGARVAVGQGSFDGFLGETRHADLHLFGMPLTVDKSRLFEIRDRVDATCWFLLDSGEESALA